MTHRISHRRGQYSSTLQGRKVVRPPARETPTSIARELGECVYFIRSNDDLVKIGHTTNIAKRKSAFSVGWGSILAIVPGTYEDEQNLHRRFAEHRARGAEWYHPASTIIDHINEIRQRLDISPIAAW